MSLRNRVHWLPVASAASAEGIAVRLAKDGARSGHRLPHQ